MPHLTLSLLGTLAVRLDGQPVAAFESDKARALLAFLAVEADRPHRRDELAALLWPERTAAAARANLSQTLYNLRTILGDRAEGDRAPADAPDDRGVAEPFLLVQGATIQLNPAADCRVDVASSWRMFRPARRMTTAPAKSATPASST